MNFISHLNEVKEFVKKMTFTYDESHDFNHAEAVATNAYEICLHETPKEGPVGTINEDEICTVIFAAYVHDVCDSKYIDVNKGVDMIRKELKKYCTESECNNIIEIITNISYSTEKKFGYPKLSSPRQQLLRDIVSDADKIEALGEIGIMRCFAYERERSRDPSDEFIIRQNVIQHCKDKLLHLKDNYIRTQYGKTMAEKHHQVIVDFVAKY